MAYRSQTQLLVAEDLYDIGDDGHKYELVHGLLLSEPLPGGRHALVVSAVASELRNFSKPRGLGAVLAGDPGFILHRTPDTVRGPDVAFITRERYELLDDPGKAIPGPPDLAVEIVSPSNRPTAIHAKVADYLAAGTRLVWVLDPADETLTVFRNLLEPTILSADQELTAKEILPGFRVLVGELFTY